MLFCTNRVQVFLKKLSGFALLLSAAAGCNLPTQGTEPNPNETANAFVPASPGYRIIAMYPHDTKAYTQGLIWLDGNLVEGTGQPGESNLRKVDLATGKVLKQVNNAKDIFGEGITFLNGKIYQITWQNKKGFVYDAATFEKVKEFSIQTEGWGLTTNGKELIYTDGSSNLYFLDTASFRELRRVGVSDNFGPVGNLNELEFIDGFVWANRYQSDFVYKIDPVSGRVEARVDFSGLKQQAGFSVNDPMNEVLNGIAWDAAGKKMFITGKYWPKLFEVKIGE